MPPLTERLRNGRTPEELLDYIFSEIPFDVFEKRLLSLKCSCSKERVIKTPCPASGGTCSLAHSLG